MFNGAVRRSRQQAQRGDPFPATAQSAVQERPRATIRGRHRDCRAGVRGLSVAAVSRRAISTTTATRTLWCSTTASGARAAEYGRAATALARCNALVDSRFATQLQARITIVERGGRTLSRRVQVDGSYCNASDPRVIFGLAADGAPRTVRVQWADGRVDEFRGLTADRYGRSSADNRRGCIALGDASRSGCPRSG